VVSGWWSVALQSARPNFSYQFGVNVPFENPLFLFLGIAVFSAEKIFSH